MEIRRAHLRMATWKLSATQSDRRTAEVFSVDGRRPFNDDEPSAWR